MSAQPLRLRSSAAGRQRWEAPALHRRPNFSAAVEDSLQREPGIVSATANPTTGKLLVVFSNDVDPESVEVAVRRAIDATPLSQVQMRERSEALAARAADDASCYEAGGACCDVKDQSDAKLQRYVRKLWLGGVVLAGIVIRRLIFGAAAAAGGGPVFLAVAGVATVITGWAYLRGAFNSLFRRGRVTTDTLVGSATVASILLGEMASALIVIWLLNLGEYLQTLTIRRTRQAIRDLLGNEDDTAWVVEGEVEMKRPMNEIRPGDLVAVYAGERIPVDGAIELGEATINEAPITGESMPVERAAGTFVFAGTVVMAGHIRIRVSTVGADTAIGRLIQRVEEAQELKPRIQTIGERFASKFVPFSFLLAAAVFIMTGNPTQALTMLLIACPCAAGLATPTAVSASIGNAAKRGILIKGGTHLEAAAELDIVVFDKTGTLTEGKPTVRRVITYNGVGENEVLALAAGAELHSQHPLALAIVAAAQERGIEPPPHEECVIRAGRGVIADTKNGRVFVGNRRLLEEHGIDTCAGEKDEAASATTGESVVFIGYDNHLAGMIGVSDRIRPGANAALERLRASGVQHLIMLTGDSEEVAAAVARSVSLSEWRSRLLPEEKFDWIRQLREEGHRVAMVGDGINDAPALALADVGIAMGTAGSDVAIEAADVALAADNLEHVGTTLQLSRRTIKLIRQNYGLALGVNSVGIIAGAFGALNPLLAAVLHNLSTLLVVINSTRLIKYNPDTDYALLRTLPTTTGPLLQRTLPNAPPREESVRPKPCVDDCCAATQS